MPRLKCYDVLEMKARLTKAFRNMRKEGLLARQNFECCSSCAGYSMTLRARELISNGKEKSEIKGCCFYHAQDNDDLVVGRGFYLSYGPMDSQEHGVIGLSNEEVAKIVIKCLKDAGVETDWDGNGGRRIFVTGLLN